LKIDYKLIFTLILLSFLLGSCSSQNDTLQNLINTNYFRIVVPTAGYYRIVLQDLIKLGLPDPDLSKLNLYYSGNPYPFWIDKTDEIEDTIIYFYAPPPEKASNIKETIFFLAFDGQATENRLYTFNTPKVAGQDFQLSVGTMIQHLEEQNVYLPDSKSDDRWYWSLLSTEDEVDIKFSLEDFPLSSLKIRAHLWSPSSAPNDPDHAIRLVVNQSNIEDIVWDGKGEYTAETIVSLSENNTPDISIQILLNEVAKQIPQKIYLDRVEVEYQQSMKFSGETLHFISGEELVMQTDQEDGFLLSSTKEKIPQKIYFLPEETITSIPDQTETHFSWVPEANFKAVNNIQAIEKPQIELTPVEYLVIAPKALHPTLTPLINFRNQQGYRTALLSNQQIYDYFNSGTPSPFAIQSFLQHLYAESSENLKYLLLVGDYSYEVLDYESSSEMLPSFFMDTSLAGETVSDFPYVDFDKDHKPDLAMGRIPTSDATQLAIWVNQLLNYEKQTAKTLQHIISISDPSSSTFQDSASSFLESLDSYPERSRIQITGDGCIQKNQAVFAEQNSLIAFFGHGSIDRWGQSPILSSQQIQEMEAPFYPAFIFSFSCLNGYFIHPQTTSLAETLLFHPNSGTVAVLASTSLTMHESQIEFSNQIISALQLGGKVKIGDLVTSAMREIDIENQLNLDVIKTFILFGDPATSFPSIQTPQGN